jgi:hypothetical protein
MRRSFLAVFLAASLAAAALLESPCAAQSDRQRRGYGPVVMVGPPPQPFYRRYAGPVPGRYGSPYYHVANNRAFAPPAPYAPSGAPVAGGYLPSPTFASGYAGAPYASAWPMVAGDWLLYGNPLLQATMLENELRWGTALPPGYPEARTRARSRRSTPDQQVKSLHAQAQGDVWMKKLRFLNAYERYKVAQSAASDRPEPYFRLGFSLTAVGNFDSAVKYFKQGLDIDPQWPTHPDKLDALFGDDNRLSVLTLIERVGNWVREDIRDPDRLFLIGVVLHADGDTRASQFFEAAYRLGGSGDHLLAFLHPPAADAPPVGAPGLWYGSNGNNRRGFAPTGPYGSGAAVAPNAGNPAPQPAEPQEGIPPQMVAPPDFGPAGQRQGLFSPPQSPPRGLYDPVPQDVRPRSPGNGRPLTAPQMPLPIRPAPSTSPAPETTPSSPTGQNGSGQQAAPAVPALPLPPLPAPEEPSGEGQGGARGPSLEGPTLAPPS